MTNNPIITDKRINHYLLYLISNLNGVLNTNDIIKLFFINDLIHTYIYKVALTDLDYSSDIAPIIIDKLQKLIDKTSLTKDNEDRFSTERGTYYTIEIPETARFIDHMIDSYIRLGFHFTVDFLYNMHKQGDIDLFSIAIKTEKGEWLEKLFPTKISFD
jgi:hypothetical protein